MVQKFVMRLLKKLSMNKTLLDHKRMTIGFFIFLLINGFKERE